MIFAPRCDTSTDDSPQGARVFLRQALDAALSLAEFAERGRVVPDLSDPEVREIFVGKYRLLYEVHPNEVWVMRLLHGSRDFLSAWGRRREAGTEREDK
ncbi:MAG TPA: type II toxin-antitoxin system RelE/ParE family toxin [Vicinamibacteria bacterium]|nr:type II toxin-antitoxin system RelE/ParE family toxin [Vicinamibacteria bacterium]